MLVFRISFKSFQDVLHDPVLTLNNTGLIMSPGRKWTELDYSFISLIMHKLHVKFLISNKLKWITMPKAPTFIERLNYKRKLPRPIRRVSEYPGDVSTK